ncbi:RpiB/LacA/LacB family sugar-phosphate isomerase [Clostridium oryzae]|uniref:Putative sugar phosphate isomerase YwlF n=1 Tax=Clostridium oryzae TaxID=1450648 RepID=A0A1V4I469_9CLOT|nr:RpiB/LacA/LacB family sugar-phosphate isomerase [Clostridium oryzae]OPJ54781.1 putative sugar phosphate isomerase YwlF [Clostridium oryzae]
MKIALGTDQKSVLYDEVVKYLSKNEIEYEDFHNDNNNWCDVGIKVGESISKQFCNEGILLCSTGTGVAIAANKVKDIRAVSCCNSKMTKMAKYWNHANVLCIGIQFVNISDLNEILDSWFSTPYGNGEAGYAIDTLHDYELSIRG